MQIAFSGSITAETYVRALRLHMKPRPVADVLGALLLAVMLGGTVVAPLLVPSSGRPAFWQLIAITSAALFFWYAPHLTARRAFATGKLLHSPVRGVADETSVQLATENGSADLPWTVFYKARVARDLVVLYQSAYLFNMFPRSWFGSDADWAAFQQLVATKAPRPKQGLGQLGWTILLIVLVIVLTLIAWSFQQ